ncbi:MAG: TniB family NTP-binding protein [Pseudomonadota bacterium]
MNTPYEHLHPTAARMVGRSISARFSFIERDRVLETPPLLQTHDRLAEMYAHPQISRPPNLAIIAASGAGKSHAVKDFLRQHPRRRTADGRLRLPILFVEYPPFAGQNWLATAMLAALGYEAGLPRETSRLHELIIERLILAGTRLIIIEEVSRLYKFASAHLLDFYGFIVWLSNQSQVPIVLTGIEELSPVIEGDLQLVRRFERLEILPWKLGQDFTDFVHTYLSMMPLAEPSQIDRSMLERLMEASQGNTDTLVKALQRAAKAAILDKQERLLLKHVKNIDAFSPPPVAAGRRVQRRRRHK